MNNAFMGTLFAILISVVVLLVWIVIQLIEAQHERKALLRRLESLEAQVTILAHVRTTTIPTQRFMQLPRKDKDN